MAYILLQSIFFKKDWKKTIAQNRHISIILGIHDL